MLSFENLRRLIIQGSGPIFCDYTVHHPGEVVVTTDIAGPPETVFEALIDPAQLNRYMADKAVVEPHVGGKYDFGWFGGPIKILEIEPGRKLSYSWRYGDDPETIVSWALEGSEGGTRLTLVHSGFAPDRPTDDYRTGWHRFVNDLKSMIEIGSSWTEATTDRAWWLTWVARLSVLFERFKWRLVTRVLGLPRYAGVLPERALRKAGGRCRKLTAGLILGMHSQKRDAAYGFAFQTRNSSLGYCPSALVARAMLGQSMSRELKTTAAHNNNCYSMRKFLLGLIAVASVLLPLSQNAQAHWGYYHRYYGGYHHAYWHHGYWYAGCWRPGYCYPGPVTVVVAP